MFLHLLLKEAQKFGLKDVMVTCADNNFGSSGIIKSNFGVFKDMVFDPKSNCNINRYIIDVDKSIFEFEKRYFKINSKETRLL